VGSEFHAAESANAKLCSPILRRVAGCSYRQLLAEWSRERDAILEVDVTSSDITTDYIRYEWGAWEYTVWMSPVVQQEASAARMKPAARDYADQDHWSVSRQHSERAAMEQWLTLVAQPTLSCSSPTDLARKRWSDWLLFACQGCVECGVLLRAVNVVSWDYQLRHLYAGLYVKLLTIDVGKYYNKVYSLNSLKKLHCASNAKLYFRSDRITKVSDHVGQLLMLLVEASIFNLKII